ncbi:MAG: SIS domain-containing protein [Fimbriimonadaceae bacterium]|nr:SIS domain-containing protein [Fimbriimonadaceae bacterium]
MKGIFDSSFHEAAACLEEFRRDEQTLQTLAQIAQRLLECFRSGGKALVIGNGGSLADAMHFAEEWTGRFRNDRPPYPVIALSDPTHMSCVGNDYGFEEVFARPVRALGRPGDLLFVLSTSGRSQNLVRACLAAREAQMAVIGLLGRGGGDVLPLCDLMVLAPGKTSDRIQEIHMLALHVLIEAVESQLP